MRAQPLLAAAFAWALATGVATPARSGAGPSRSEIRRAEAHFQEAVQLLDRNTIDSRRFAMRELEQAILLVPSNPTYQLTLGRAYYESGFLKSARHCFEKVVAVTPNDPDGLYGLGQVWRRDWLKFLDRQSLALAVHDFSLSARARPGSADAWLMMVPLLVEQEDLRAAHAAATRAREAASARPDGLLAYAYTAYRLGMVDRADSAFNAAMPRLPRSVRERFEDISPVASERDTFLLRRMRPPEAAEFVRRFWRDIDPDLATRQNEAQLEYWARVSHAYFLFYNPRRREWDERAEVYVRYGPPKSALYNPVGVSLYGWGGSPRNLLQWDYPDLGMRVVMEDRLLSEFYMLPITRTFDPDPIPDYEVLARNPDQLTVPSGRGVFPRLPPNVEPLPVDGAVASFETPNGLRLLAQVESPGEPSDSLWAEWVVLDSTLREVQRGSRTLSPSACGATARRVADFAADLTPGDYRVGLSVRDRQGRRGLYRADVRLPEIEDRLSLSDLVISCGAPAVEPVSGGAPAVRLEPNPGARVAGESPLTAYFEIYHLSPDANGQSRFEYVYTVSSAEKDPRIWLKRLFAPRSKPDPIEVSREEENPGALRRQFVTVPVQSLPAGRYKFEVRVRDLVANAEAAVMTEFVKLGTVAQN